MTANKPRELVVDLDDTLVRTDVLWESFFTLLGRSPFRAIATLSSLTKGRAAFKKRVAFESPVDPGRLPYRNSVICEMLRARDDGRKVVLATAADENNATAIASSLAIIDLVLASDGLVNLSGYRKAEAIRKACGGDFEYIGNSQVDLPIWRLAKVSLVVNPSSWLLRRLRNEGLEFRVLLDERSSSLKNAWRAMRPQQWVKNILLFVPIVMAQKLTEWPAVQAALLTFAGLSLSASGTYILNDLFDIDADRNHPRKRNRPFASGELSIPIGACLSGLLIAGGISTGLAAAPVAALGIFLYVVMTLLYSSILKTKVLADVIALAGLYVYRILLGGAVSGITISHWLAVFSAFMFLSLALSKRASELIESQQSGSVNARRGYRISDIPLLMSLGVTTGVAAILVYCLYISGETASELYHAPKWLWLAAPPFFYWIMRIWFLTERGELKDDPIVFTFRDRHTYVVGAAIAGAFLLAKLWH